MDKLLHVLEYADTHGIYPDLKIVESGAEPEVLIEGKKVLMFSSNNYLGLATEPRVIEAAVEATRKYGVGSDGSRLLSGNLDVHRAFEEAIARFKGGEDAIAIPSGFGANVGVIAAIMNPLKVDAGSFFARRGVILSDELNHASIIDGCAMSKQKVVVYKHSDMADLEKKLRHYRYRRKLVVTDSVFSMDGDIAPLDQISALCKKYNAMLMIDEAHATGVIGKTGHGTMELFGLKPTRDVDIVLGTCSKALASSGGFVVGSKDLIRYLRVACRSYMFSTAGTPASSASLIKVLEIMETEPSHRERLTENASYTRTVFKNAGFDTLGSATQIIPILIGDDTRAITFSRKLFERGIFGPCVRWPAVEKGKARIRFTIMATHTKEQIDFLVKNCTEIAKELNLLS
jgi:8-amino-7-oxononanoate synthase